MLSKLRKSGIYFKNSLHKYWALYLIMSPVLIYFALFIFWPMYGILIAFKDYVPSLGIWESPWVGLKHFQNFFQSINFTRTLRNTLGISFYSLVAGFPLPIILAILMNELTSKRFKSALQTITYLPHFISTVVMCGMIMLFLRYDGGLINTLIELLGGQPVDFMTKPEYFKSIYVWSGIWQNLGWSSIIYMATLSGLDVQMYEAASIDGASKMQQIFRITIPCLMPTAVLLLILDSGSIMNVGFEKVFLLQNGLNMETSDVISTLVYRKGILENSYSFSTAVGLFNSLVNCTILLVVNGVSKKLSDTSLF